MADARQKRGGQAKSADSGGLRYVLEARTKRPCLLSGPKDSFGEFPPDSKKAHNCVRTSARTDGG